MISSWLEKSSWPAVRIKYACINSFSGGTPDTSNTSYWNDGNVPWIASGELQNCDVRNATSYITNKGLANSSAKIIKKGSVAIAMTGATCANVGYITFDTAANQSVYAYIIKDNYNARFVYYSLIAMRNEILSKQNGGAQAGINGIVCKNLYIPKINLNDQQKIADYLDKKVSIIDRLIDNINKQIKELKAYELSKIEENVFGRTEQKEVKNSNIQWINAVPKDWRIIKLKFISQIRGRIGFRGYTVQDLVEPDEKGAAIVLGGTNIMKEGTISYEKLTYISEKKYLESPEIMLRGGEILITKVGAGTGENALYKYFTERVTINPNVMLCVPDSDQVPEFINYFLLTPTVREIMAIESRKSGAQPAINQEFIKNLPVVYPTKYKQELIVNEINKMLITSTKLIQIKQQKIVELNKYKKSLIYECVTGKKEIL